VRRYDWRSFVPSFKPRTHHAGQATFIEFHLVAPGSMSVAHSHEISDRLEGAFKKTLKGAIAIIHVELKHKAKHVRSIQKVASTKEQRAGQGPGQFVVRNQGAAAISTSNPQRSH
jgi:hypothetical protein